MSNRFSAARRWRGLWTARIFQVITWKMHPLDGAQQFAVVSSRLRGIVPESRLTQTANMKVIGNISAILEHKDRQIWAIAPEATVFDAIRLMSSKNVGALVVLERERLAGIISERDYTRKVILKGKSSRDTEVREIMSTPVVVVSPEHSVEECMRLVTEHRVRHLPVLDGDRVVGVVSIGDLVKWIISAQSTTINQLEGYITGQYPG